MKILIIQIRQMGDVLLSTPLAEAIKEIKPNYEVHFLTDNSSYDILSLNPFIDKIITISAGVLNEIKIIKIIRKEKYDAVIDIQRTGRSKRITLLSLARLRVAFEKTGDNFYYNRVIRSYTHGYTVFERMDLLKAIDIIPKNKYMPKLFFSPLDLEHVKEYLNEKKVKNFFVVSPTARKKEKMWMPDEFGKLAEKVRIKTGLEPVIVYGTDSERAIAVKCAKYIKKGHLINKPFNIKEFTALVNMSSFFIGNDSFPAHVSVSQNIKTVIICGPTSGWFLENDRTMLIYKGLKCQPCNDYKSCKLDMLCYKSLKNEDIIDPLLSFIL